MAFLPLNGEIFDESDEVSHLLLFRASASMKKQAFSGKFDRVLLPKASILMHNDKSLEFP